MFLAQSTFPVPISYPTQCFPLPSFHHLLQRIHNSSHLSRYDVRLYSTTHGSHSPDMQTLTLHTLLLIITLQLLCKLSLQSCLPIRNSSNLPTLSQTSYHFPNVFLPEFNHYSNFQCSACSASLFSSYFRCCTLSSRQSLSSGSCNHRVQQTMNVATRTFFSDLP